MHKNFIIILCLLPLFLVVAQEPKWDKTKKEALNEFCQTKLTKTLLIYQDGELEFTYGDDSKIHKIFSIRKSLVSLLYGVYSARGEIDLEATLEDLEIDDIGGLTKSERQATVLNLLQARSGVYHEAAFETPGMLKKRPERGSHSPGTFWYYNNWDFNALTTILEQQTGLSIFEAFDQNIAKPLRLQDFSKDLQTYVYEENRSKHKATLWQLSGRDLLKIGIMVLNKGKINGKQIIPEGWIERSAARYSQLGMFGAYGLCWWVAMNGQHYPFVNFPDGTFSARGTGMQDLIIVPEYDMVIVHQTEVNSPDDTMMKVTSLGRLLKQIMDQ